MTDWKINQTHDVILVILAAVYSFPGDIQTNSQKISLAS